MKQLQGVRSDEAWMRRALRLAALGREASPNPMVGCVIVDSEGVFAGEGWHHRPGEAHAEVNALASAGERSRNGTAFVTLEPCSHFGRTPPCSSALIAAGVSRVVIAMEDPDSRVRGSGTALLRRADIAVTTGVLAEQAARLNECYIKHRTTGLPFVTVKTAMTLDGRTATVTGDSRWITSATTRLWVHRGLRSRNDAILVGAGTVIADDPSLTVRLSRGKGRNPWRVVLDSHCRLPLDSAVVRQASVDGKTVLAYVSADADVEAALTERGCRLIKVDANPAGRVDLAELLKILGTTLPVTGVLVEGGSEVIAAFAEIGQIDRYVCCIGPAIVGGRSAPGPVGGLGLAREMAGADKWRVVSARRSAGDFVLDCRRA